MTAPRRGGEATPWWFTVIIIIVALPMFNALKLASDLPAGSELGFLSWLFPAYIVVSGFCAWMCYADRRALAWILIVLMILSNIGIFMML